MFEVAKSLLFFTNLMQIDKVKFNVNFESDKFLYNLIY